MLTRKRISAVKFFGGLAKLLQHPVPAQYGLTLVDCKLKNNKVGPIAGIVMHLSFWTKRQRLKMRMEVVPVPDNNFSIGEHDVFKAVQDSRLNRKQKRSLVQTIFRLLKEGVDKETRTSV